MVLGHFKKVIFVAPAEEQSWISQAITRFRPLFAREHNFEVCDGYLVSGTPADCVGLGLHNLYSSPADFVFSGINLGTNATVPFFYNSGTVGGARQGFTFGVRSIAFSVLVPDKIFNWWREDDQQAMIAHAHDWQRIADKCAQLAGGLLNDECWHGVDLFSINLPWEVEQSTPVRLTQLAPAVYQPLFDKQPDGRFQHHFRGFVSEKSAVRVGSKSDGELADDIAVLRAGEVSLTPVAYQLNALQPTTKQALVSSFK